MKDDGTQCRNSAREGSKYCAAHRGYQPKTAKAIAEMHSTKPAVDKAKHTKPAVRKAAPKKKN
ncbi:MAG: hypothetical protein CVT48_05780 [Thermoplasmata archaeon HGW-Thermoplasmata-1]|nr:MAG: hypothetical protein CVT48_05780 [Thermoplasmata archaeon HGW-Thermoplasmata-1]